ATTFNLNEYEDKPATYGDRAMFDALRRAHPNDFNACLQAAVRIREGLTLSSSIDDFLDIHNANPHIKAVGKAAIVTAVLDAEKHSGLRTDPTKIHSKINFPAIENTWFVKFMRMLGRGVPPANVRSIFDDIAFIVFNYDRCIEQFLTKALQHLY